MNILDTLPARWTAARLHDVFDGARGVVVHEDRGLVSVWHGGSTVNIHCAESGECLDAWTQYDMDAQDFQRTAIEHIKQEENPV